MSLGSDVLQTAPETDVHVAGTEKRTRNRLAPIREHRDEWTFYCHLSRLLLLPSGEGGETKQPPHPGTRNNNHPHTVSATEQRVPLKGGDQVEWVERDLVNRLDELRTNHNLITPPSVFTGFTAVGAS